MYSLPIKPNSDPDGETGCFWTFTGSSTVKFMKFGTVEFDFTDVHKDKHRKSIYNFKYTKCAQVPSQDPT